MKDIKLKFDTIGNNKPVFISAEIGVTCNGDLSLTKELIDATKNAGANAVKLIFWFPEEFMKNTNQQYSYKRKKNGKIVNIKENMFDMLKKLKFTIDDWYKIKDYADKKKITLLSTVNSPSGFNYARKINLEAYKVSSWDFNYFPLWQKLKKVGKPIIVDTGPVYDHELSKVVKIIKQNEKNKLLLVHCFHTTNFNEMNMRSITYLQKRYKCLVGYSPTDQDFNNDIMSVALGSVYLEKRLTMSRKLSGHHHILSMQPKELEIYVKNIRNGEKILGQETLIPSKADLIYRKLYFRHITAKNYIAKDTKIKLKDLIYLRPEKGISPENVKKIINKKIKKNIYPNQTIKTSDFY
jgi:N,N'-diacetyllegionaminate synthase